MLARRTAGLSHLPTAGGGVAGAPSEVGAKALLCSLNRARRAPVGHRLQRRRDTLRAREGILQEGNLHRVVGGHGQERESTKGEQGLA